MALSPTESIRETFLRCLDMDASLKERLDTFATALTTADPAFAQAVDRLVGRLQRAKLGAGAPGVGDILPPFHLPDQDGRIVSLPALLEEGPVAVVMHRGHWCPYCRINTRALAQARPRIEAARGRIAAILPDRQRYAAMIRAAGQADFPILTDMDNGYAMSLNLVFWVGQEMQTLMAEAGIDLAEYQDNQSWMVPVPATFVVGQDGVIKARFVDPDYRKRMTVESMIAAFGA